MEVFNISYCFSDFQDDIGEHIKVVKEFLQSFEDMVDGTPAGQYIWYYNVLYNLYIYCPVGGGDIKEFLQSFEDMVDGTPAGQYIWYYNV